MGSKLYIIYTHMIILISIIDFNSYWNFPNGATFVPLTLAVWSEAANCQQSRCHKVCSWQWHHHWFSNYIYDIYIQAGFQSFKDSNKFSSLKRNSFFKCVLQFQWALASSWLRRRQIKSQESKNIFLTSIQLSLKYNV